MKSTTKKGAKSTPDETKPNCELAAERVAAILDDPTSPTFLRDVLEDMVLDLSNETDTNDADPEIARLIMRKAFPKAEAAGLRQWKGMLRRKGGGIR
jgi:hypothetical protein